MLNRFFKKSDGGASLEIVLWFPFLLLVFGLMLDISMMFFGQAKTLRIVQDINREFSVGERDDTADTVTAIQAELVAVDVTPTSISTNVSLGVAITRVRVPLNQFTVLGLFDSINDLSIDITAEHMIENWEKT